MRVLLAHDKGTGSRGGMQTYLANLERALRERGVEVRQLQFTAAARGRRTGVAPHDNRLHLPSRGRSLDAAGAWRIARLAQRVGADVIHLHSVHYALGPVALWLLPRLRPVVYTLHDVTPLCFRRTRLTRDGRVCSTPVGLGCLTSGCHAPADGGGLARTAAELVLTRLQVRALRSLPILIVPSRALAEHLRCNGIGAGRVEVLPHFTPVLAYAPSPPPAAPGLAFVGKVALGKGILELLRALALLVDVPWICRVAGTGEAEAEARELSIRLGLAGRVEFLGEVAGARAVLESARVVAVPSLAPESFGLVGLEAMACGRPVVAFDAGGTREWLRDGATGFLVPRGDLRAMADALRRLLTDYELCRRLGEAGARDARERFGEERHVDRLLDLYRRAAGGRAEVRAVSWAEAGR